MAKKGVVNKMNKVGKPGAKSKNQSALLLRKNSTKPVMVDLNLNRSLPCREQLNKLPQQFGRALLLTAAAMMVALAATCASSR